MMSAVRKTACAFLIIAVLAVSGCVRSGTERKLLDLREEENRYPDTSVYVTISVETDEWFIRFYREPVIRNGAQLGKLACTGVVTNMIPGYYGTFGNDMTESFLIVELPDGTREVRWVMMTAEISGNRGYHERHSHIVKISSDERLEIAVETHR